MPELSPTFIAAGITGIVALLASVASLILGIKNHGLAQRKLSLDEEAKQAEARRLTDKYRNPLVVAAQELSSRLYAIQNMDFFLWATRGPCEKAYVETHTLYVFAAFLGWMELMAQEVQFLDLGSVERSKKLNSLLAAVRSTLRASHLGDEHTFRLFQGQQRAIGEAMIVDKGGGRGVMGYKAFCESYWDKRNPTLAFWLHPLAESIRRIVEAYDMPGETLCQHEHRLMLFLELEMRFPRLDNLWQTLAELIRHLDPECAYHNPDQLDRSPNSWALVTRRRSELELRLKEDPEWPRGSQWSGSRLLEACRTGKAKDWLKKTIEAEWQRCPLTLMPMRMQQGHMAVNMPLLLQLEAAQEADDTEPSSDKPGGGRHGEKGSGGGGGGGGGGDKGGGDKGGGDKGGKRDDGKGGKGGGGEGGKRRDDKGGGGGGGGGGGVKDAGSQGLKVARAYLKVRDGDGGGQGAEQGFGDGGGGGGGFSGGGGGGGGGGAAAHAPPGYHPPVLALPAPTPAMHDPRAGLGFGEEHPYNRIHSLQEAAPTVLQVPAHEAAPAVQPHSGVGDDATVVVAHGNMV